MPITHNNARDVKIISVFESGECCASAIKVFVKASMVSAMGSLCNYSLGLIFLPFLGCLLHCLVEGKNYTRHICRQHVPPRATVCCLRSLVGYSQPWPFAQSQHLLGQSHIHMPPLFSFHMLPSFHTWLHSGPLQQPHFHGIGIDQAYNKSRFEVGESSAQSKPTDLPYIDISEDFILQLTDDSRIDVKEVDFGEEEAIFPWETNVKSRLRRKDEFDKCESRKRCKERREAVKAFIRSFDKDLTENLLRSPMTKV
uniref:Uncharacterized protein n=1 Tax=Cucumis melo TaxID=3656 RepID=A0A9I9D877_CUCME